MDKAIADSILKELLAVPGGILNVKRISDTIHSNPSTIERYISIFMRRFLISALPNLRSAPGKQLFTRAKIHPVDTSFSVETIRQSGRDFHNDRVLFGELLNHSPSIKSFRKYNGPIYTPTLSTGGKLAINPKRLISCCYTIINLSLWK